VERVFQPPKTEYGAGHRGVDLAAAAGQPVVAALGGTVTFSGRVAGVGWITVDHGAALRTTYGPLDPRVATAGDLVAAGELLGFVARGAAHLDWGARLDGQYVDPLALLSGWETYLTRSDDVLDLPALGGPNAIAGPATTGRGGLRLPVAGVVTSDFGPRTHPVTGEQRLHAGLDIAAPQGRPVRAAAGGTVAFAGTLSGYGGTVIVDHGGGTSTLYAHQSVIGAAAGEAVTAGEQIGRVGATGVATGPHLHFEVRVDGAPQNPAGWLRS
jgi:murein DD-endopeptidase MepM/ murein hydrolase activator NlpD